MVAVGVLSNFQLVAVYPFTDGDVADAACAGGERRRGLIARAARRVVVDGRISELEASAATYILATEPATEQLVTA